MGRKGYRVFKDLPQNHTEYPTLKVLIGYKLNKLNLPLN